LTFGFIMMTPQLFINYKMKSVAHLPWRMLSYKAINTFIDDMFAFVIKTPTLYRLGCLRDDVIFFIFLYQRWIYPIDPHRINEFGYNQEMLNSPAPASEVNGTVPSGAIEDVPNSDDVESTSTTATSNSENQKVTNRRQKKQKKPVKNSSDITPKVTPEVASTGDRVAVTTESSITDDSDSEFILEPPLGNSNNCIIVDEAPVKTPSPKKEPISDKSTVASKVKSKSGKKESKKSN